MRTVVFILMAAAFTLALPLTWAMRALGRRAAAWDGPGVAGQVKAASRRVPNTGGVAIFLAIVGPMLAALAAVWFAQPALVRVAPAIEPHVAGIREFTPVALALVACLAVLHVVGLIDDRRPLGPGIKLAVMLACAAAIAATPGTRLLTALDGWTPGGVGVALSFTLTVLWIGVVTNAMNFMDNMDGLTAGVAAIASACFLAGTLLHDTPQYFVGACLALLIGACAGFLVFNFPFRAGGATIFMGDGGSLVIGFLLAVLTVRTTYYAPAHPDAASPAGGWYAVLMPIVILAVPLYDFVSVCAIRISQGRSPFVGDLQHLSHRLHRRGLSRRDTVLVMYGLTGITAVGGISLGSLRPWQAALVGVQTLLVLGILAVYERRAASPGDAA